MKLTPVSKIMFGICAVMGVLLIYKAITGYDVIWILLCLNIVQIGIAWHVIRKLNKKQ